MPGPAGYAQVVPKARILKSMLLTPDKIKEMMATPELKDALAQLRESLYQQASEASTIEDAYRQLETAYMAILVRLEKAAPQEAIEAVRAFRRDYELRDILTGLQKVITGTPGFEELPTYHIEGSLLRKIAQDPEALASYTRFVEALEGSWAHPYVIQASRIYGETKNPMLVSWVHLYGSLDMYTKTLSGSMLEAERLSAIICPIVEQRVGLSLLQAKVGGIDSRLLEQLLTPSRQCGLDPSYMRQAYDREATPEDLAMAVREYFKYVKFEGSSLGELLVSVRRSGRMSLRRAIMSVFQSYPFTSAIMAATAAMIRIEVEDVSAILTSISLKLKVDEYSQLLIIDK